MILRFFYTFDGDPYLNIPLLFYDHFCTALHLLMFFVYEVYKMRDKGELKFQQEIANDLINIPKFKNIEAMEIEINFQRLIKKKTTDETVLKFSI